MCQHFNLRWSQFDRPVRELLQLKTDPTLLTVKRIIMKIVDTVKLFALSLLHGDFILCSFKYLNFISNIWSAASKCSHSCDEHNCVGIVDGDGFIIISVAKYDVGNPDFRNLKSKLFNILFYHLLTSEFDNIFKALSLLRL